MVVERRFYAAVYLRHEARLSNLVVRIHITYYTIKEFTEGEVKDVSFKY